MTQTKIKISCNKCGHGVQWLDSEDITKRKHGLCPKCRKKLVKTD